MKTHYDKIDYEKLKQYINNNGISQHELSKKIGMSKCYIGNAITQKNMSKTAYKMVCTILNVNESMFLLPEEFYLESKKETAEMQIDESKIDRIIELLETLIEKWS